MMMEPYNYDIHYQRGKDGVWRGVKLLGILSILFFFQFFGGAVQFAVVAIADICWIIFICREGCKSQFSSTQWSHVKCLEC